MPHRILAFCDTLIIGLVTIVSALCTQLLAVESATRQVDELRVLLIPLIGALISTGGMALFQIEKEPRNIVIGRAIFGLLFGAGFMPAMSTIFPSMAVVMERPVIMLLSGAVMSMFFYAVAYFLAKGLFRRSKSYADGLLDQAERRAGFPQNPDRTIRQIKTAAYEQGKSDERDSSPPP